MPEDRPVVAIDTPAKRNGHHIEMSENDHCGSAAYLAGLR
jgi:hypothetical protein